jgi:prepilin-type N-terminal cleavage/methylation domain-containing protein
VGTALLAKRVNNSIGQSAHESRGFTLIELLVVIAIIGILAALVLVALNNARQSGQDARIKSDVAQLRDLAEIHYDSNNASYTGFDSCLNLQAEECRGGTAEGASALVNDIIAAGGEWFVGFHFSPGGVPVYTDGQRLCLSAFRVVPEGYRYFCVDSDGHSSNGTVDAISETSWPCDIPTVHCQTPVPIET